MPLIAMTATLAPPIYVMQAHVHTQQLFARIFVRMNILLLRIGTAPGGYAKEGPRLLVRMGRIIVLEAISILVLAALTKYAKDRTIRLVNTVVAAGHVFPSQAEERVLRPALKIPQFARNSDA